MSETPSPPDPSEFTRAIEAEVQAWFDAMSVKLDRILANQSTEALRASRRFKAAVAFRQDEAGQAVLWVDQQEQIDEIKARLTRLEAALGVTPPPMPLVALSDRHA